MRGQLSVWLKKKAISATAVSGASEPWQTGRIAAMLSSASALLEAFRHREAAARAEAARELAARCRNPYWEGRAEWLARSALYRTGEAAGPDLELVEAVVRVGVPQLEALVCLDVRDGVTEPGPEIAFMATAPTAGRYLLYLDLKLEGRVISVPFVVTATGAATDGAAAGAHDDTDSHERGESGESVEPAHEEERR